MKIFDLKTMTAFPYTERGKNVLYKADEFKARIIQLPPGGEMPTCEMASHVVFFVVKGSAEVNVDGEVAKISDGQLLVTPPATLSMKTTGGVKIAAIQIEKD
jgi:quercetin dioxygenase-like cupin family protein